MRLLSKLTLTSTLSKVIIALLFILLLPFLIDRVAFRSTNKLLQKQERQVLRNIEQNGVEYYLQGDSSFGSYTILKEEYISLELIDSAGTADTILSDRRIIENDTADYRILQRTFQYDNKLYALEIGRTLNSVSQYNAPLQRIALVVLSILIFFTMLTDVLFTRVLLKPLQSIMKSKVQQAVFPFKEIPPRIKTTTSDFANLDSMLVELMNRINDDFNREREFTSNASHELLTPIGILQTKMENLLLQEDLEGPIAEKLLGMMNTLQRLRKIVQSLLLIARIENDQYGKEDTIVVSDTVGDILEELQPAIDDKEIVTDVNVAPKSTVYPVNRDLFRQLLYNIIHNAIRYNKRGGVIKIHDSTSREGQYVISIIDTGEGMAAAEVSDLFQRFRKKRHGAEGYGLGLSIVKAIADYHQCNIAVVSETQTGTTFTLTFNQSFLTTRG